MDRGQSQELTRTKILMMAQHPIQEVDIHMHPVGEEDGVQTDPISSPEQTTKFKGKTLKTFKINALEIFKVKFLKSFRVKFLKVLKVKIENFLSRCIENFLD